MTCGDVRDWTKLKVVSFDKSFLKNGFLRG